jgi:hypothetical protein
MILNSVRWISGFSNIYVIFPPKNIDKFISLWRSMNIPDDFINQIYHV